MSEDRFCVFSFFDPGKCYRECVPFISKSTGKLSAANPKKVKLYDPETCKKCNIKAFWKIKINMKDLIEKDVSFKSKLEKIHGKPDDPYQQVNVIFLDADHIGLYSSDSPLEPMQYVVNEEKIPSPIKKSQRSLYYNLPKTKEDIKDEEKLEINDHDRQILLELSGTSCPFNITR